MKDKSKQLLDDLMKKFVDLENAEKELQAANQQLDASNQQLRASDQQLRAANQQLAANNQQLTASENEIRKYAHDLGERIKELDCLFEIAEFIRIRETIAEILQDTANIITSVWHYPEITRGKVRFDGKEYVSQSFKETKWKQSADIIVKGKVRGAIEVYYLEECPELDEGPFMKEERNLLDSMAKTISEAIERKMAEEKIKHLNRVLRAIRNVNQLITKEKDRDRLIRGICENLVQTRGYFNAWVVLLDEKGKYLTSANVGMGKDFLPMIELMKKGKITACGERALKRSDVIITENPFVECKDCPLSGKYANRGGMTVRLEFKGKIFGLVSVSIPEELINDEEERGLFKEVSEDITFALRNIEIEKWRKQTEESLKESEKRFKQIAVNSQEWIWEVDANGLYTYASPVVEKILGYEPEEIVGKKHFYDLFLLEDREDMKNSAFDVFAKKLPFREFSNRNVSKTGKEIWLLTSGVPILDEKGELLGYRGADKDITQRKQAEEKLLKIRERLELAMDAGEHGFWDWNLDTNDVYFSPRYYTMLGYKPGELPMKLETWVDLMHPDDRKTIVAEVENYVKNARAYEVEFRLKTKGGDWKWISGRGKSYKKDKNGIPHRAVGVHVDITERKQAEAELAKHREHLEELVKERTKELEEKNKKLEEFNDLFVNREFRIKELKDKVKELEKKH